MSLESVLFKLVFKADGDNAFPDLDVELITQAIQIIYNGSPTGRAMLEQIPDELVFIYFPSGGNSGVKGQYTVFYDPTEIQSTNLVDSNGNIFEMSLLRAVTHELTHAILLLEDPFNSDLPNLTTKGVDYTGDAVVKENKIMAELEAPGDRVSYTGWIDDAFLKSIGAKIGDSLSFGNNVDVVIVDDYLKNYNEIDISDKEVSSVLVGQGGNDVITGGKSVDYMYGGVGDDTLQGSEGADLLFGNDGADVLVGGKGAPIDLSALDLSKSHSEWDDGVGDILAGGQGLDEYLIHHTNRQTQNWTAEIESVFLQIDTIAETDGVGHITVQQFTDFGTYQDLKTLKIEGKYTQYRLLPGDTSIGAHEPTVTYYGNSEGYYLTSYVRSENGEDIPYVFIMQAYPYAEEPIAAIRDFRQGDFGITLEGFVGRKEGTRGDDRYQGGGPSNSLLAMSASEETVAYNETSGADPDSDQRIHMDAGNDIAYGRGGADEIRGDEGDDQLFGNEGADRLSGGDGADYLEGNEDDDTLIGNSGDDVIAGGTGNDTYIYLKGDGDDLVEGEGDFAQETDILNLADLNEYDITLATSGDDLVITISSTGETVTVAGHFASQTGSTGIESIVFASGTVWDKAAIIERIANPLINGTTGDDTLQGTSGNDVLHGGLGNDHLLGGVGSDDYLYAAGDGSDNIDDQTGQAGDADVLRLFGLKSTDVALNRVGADLRITIIASGEVVTIAGQYLASPDGAGLEEVRFADGIVLDRAALLAIPENNGDVPTIVGTGGDDTLNGAYDDDIFQGGQGDDVLIGARGSDTYLYRLGDGSDLIDDLDWPFDVDTLKLINIKSSDVVAVHNGVNLEITITSTGDIITVKNQWYTSWGNAGLESIVFSDGTWDRETIMAIEGVPIVGTDGNDTIEGTTDDDNITGGHGDDHLSGRTGSDVYVYSSGDGNDVLDDKGSDVGGVDILRLTNINAADIVATREGFALTLRVISTNAVITIEQQYSSQYDAYGFEKIEFADGSSWNRDALMELGRIPNIVGTSANDTLDGIWFNETISGGLGDDLLRGGAGGDTYVYNSGDGNDRIDDFYSSSSDNDVLRLADINAVGISLARSGLDLKITILATGEIITIDDQFDSTGYYGLEKVEFADGSYLSRADLLAINESSQTLVGTSAVDFLTGASANDTLEGKGGDDWLDGAAGSDVYIYAAGDGNDNITDRKDDRLSDVDVLRLIDLNPSDVVLVRSGADLQVRILSTGSAITVWQQFSSQSDFAGLERIEFADGSSWDRSVIMAAESGGEINGTSGNDTLNGTSGDDVFNGGLGNDRLYGAGGTDVYIYSSGDGSDYIDDEATEPNSVDTLRFTDINASDISVARNGVNLDITVLATGDVVTIDEQWYDVNGYWGFEKIEFADGSSWNRSDIMAIGATPQGPITGTAGNDTLTGTDGADTFVGGRGNDRMLGGQGADVYVYTFGDGTDYIDDEANEPEAVDTLRFTDINASDISVTRNGVNLDITVLATGDVITLDEQWYSDAAYWGFEKIDFADGSSWNREVLMNITNTVAPTTGTSGGDTLLGTGGDDVIAGLAGDDQIRGGNGSDRMDGGAGSDVAVFEYDLSAYTISGVDGRVVVVDGSFTDVITNIEKLQFNDLSISVGAGASLTYMGTAGDDAIIGSIGNDTIRGLAGNDTVNGLLGDDSLYGGLGDDLLDGLEGNDTYYYAAGDGNDTISDEAIALGDTDVLRFTDLNIGDLTISRTGEDMFITVNATGHVITINTQYYNASQGWSLETLEFADGTSLALDHLPDTSWIYGTNSAETIDGNWGKDYFFGGQGDDVINGSAGGDVYFYRQGDGSDLLNDEVGFTDALDVLRFTDLNASDLSAARHGDDVELTIVPTGAVITLKGQLLEDPGYWGIDKFEFADGSSWSREAITAFALNAIDKITVVGTSGDDTLYGTSNHDVFDGGLGSDFLLGGYGSDTYLYAAGDGTDYIDDEANAANQVDVLKFTDLNQSDIVAERDGINLKLTVVGTGDTITLDEQYYADTDYWGFEKIEFADGSVWDRDEIMDIGSPGAMIASASSASAAGSDDVLVGTEADDTFVFRGNFGHDAIIGFSAGAGSVDVIDIETDVFADFASVMAAATQSGSDTLITQDGDNSVLLKNVALSTLHQDDFRLVAAA